MNRLLGFLGALVTLLTGCSLGKMQVPPEVANRTDVLPVTNRGMVRSFNEDFGIGPYVISDVDRDWVSKSGFEVPGFARADIKTGYQFRVASQAGSRSAQCATNARIDNRGTWFQSTKIRLGCTCADAHLALETLEENRHAFRGSVRTSYGTYAIESHHRLEGDATTFEPVGYMVRNERGVAAAELLPPGRVWLDKTMSEPERAEMVCIFSGLMLFRNPTKDR